MIIEFTAFLTGYGMGVASILLYALWLSYRRR
jgi:hypothetical protein